MPSFTFANAILWAELESLLGWFWTPGRMFHTPVESPGSYFASAVYVIPVQPEFSHPSCTIMQPKSEEKVMTPVHQLPPVRHSALFAVHASLHRLPASSVLSYKVLQRSCSDEQTLCSILCWGAEVDPFNSEFYRQFISLLRSTFILRYFKL